MQCDAKYPQLARWCWPPSTEYSYWSVRSDWNYSAAHTRVGRACWHTDDLLIAFSHSFLQWTHQLSWERQSGREGGSTSCWIWAGNIDRVSGFEILFLVSRFSLHISAQSALPIFLCSSSFLPVNTYEVFITKNIVSRKIQALFLLPLLPYFTCLHLYLTLPTLVFVSGKTLKVKAETI